MGRYPNVSVKLIVRCGDKIFMLQHRADRAHDFPGGTMEWGESPEETLARELREELDYVLPHEPTFFGIYNYLSPDKSQHTVQLLYFIAVPEQPAWTVLEDAEPLWLDKAYFLEHWKGDEASVERMFSLVY